MSAIVIAVGVKNDGQAVKVVLAAEYGTQLISVSRVPHHQTVAVQLFFASAVHAKLKLQLPVGHLYGLYSGKNFFL